MKKKSREIGFKRSRWTIMLLVLFLASCVYDSDITYMRDQIYILNEKIAEMEGSFDSKIDERIDSRNSGGMADDLMGINANQAEILSEIDTLKRDIGELTGRVEDNENLISRSVETGFTTQDAINSKLDEVTKLSARMEEQERLLKQMGLEPDRSQESVSSGLVTGQAGIASDEPELYRSSLAAYNDGLHEKAQEGFKQFLKESPKSDYADNASYWVGECLMSLKQHEKAILAFNEVIKKYPKGNKVPNAMYRQAVAFLAIDDKISARLLLEKVIKQFPNNDIAKAAKVTLKSIQ